MLLRESGSNLLAKDPGCLIATNISRALLVRLHFDPLKFEGTGKYWIPGCHNFAHAFARVFSLQAVDGEHAFIERRHRQRLWRREKNLIVVSSYMHSWVEIVLPEGERVILDLFPDKNESFLPMVVKAPHPAYWVPKDKVFLKALERLRSSGFEESVQCVESAIRKIAIEENIF